MEGRSSASWVNQLSRAKPVKVVGSGDVGGCPRSLKQSEASGSKAEGPPLPPPPVVEVSREVEEAAEPELVLPRFLCPSSETKSRQAALKHWLAHSSFQEAVRTVPMV